MNRSRFLALLTLTFAFVGLALHPASAGEPTSERSFGPWEAVLFDGAALQNVKVTGDDIFIMLQPAHRNNKITMKASMAKGGPYRKWFTGNEVLESQQNDGRAADIWSDSIQSSANYIEYFSNGKLFLHLKRK
jgi:hypothetical protein